MTKAKTTFMVVTGASVGVVRDGKRKTLIPGQGENFTDEEIASINKAVPGALRKAINEGVQPTAQAVDDSDAEDDDTDNEASEKKSSKKAAAKKTPAKKAAEKSDESDDDDADEDEDI